MPWITITAPNKNHHSFDFDTLHEYQTVYALIIRLLNSDGAGYVQIPTSKSSMVIIPAYTLRESIIQIGGIQ